MAIYHFSAKTVSRKAGQSAVAKAAYNARDQLTNERTGEHHDYRRKDGILFAGIYLPKGAPEWAQDRGRLWSEAEKAERRKDATVAREYQAALPHELTAEQQRRFVQDFVKANYTRKGYAADVCIHAPDRKGDERNVHVHILVTDRRLGREGFASSKLERQGKQKDRIAELEGLRESWERLGNRHLERYGHAPTLDRRSLEAQGIDREPSRHVGVTAAAMERKGIRTSRGDINRAVAQRNQERAELEKELNQVNGQIAALEGQDKTTFRDELGAAFAQQREANAEARLEGWRARQDDREIHRAGAGVEREADKLASTAERTVDKAAHGLGVALGGVAKTVGKVFEALGDMIAPPPPPTRDQAERMERSAEERRDEAAVADEAAAKEARLQELLAQIARDDAERRRQREERGGRDEDDDRGRERERDR